MTDAPSTNIVPVRPLDEVAALAWLCSQPGGSTTLPAAALARRWGWPEHRARRRLSAWHKSGLIRRRGRVVLAVPDAVGRAVHPTVDPTVDQVTLEAVGKSNHRVAIAWKNSPSVRRAAQAAGQAAQVIDFPPARHLAEPSAEPAMEVSSDTPDNTAPDEPPPPAEPRPGCGAGTISAFALVAALALAGVSGWYSITGLTAIFVGAPMAVMALGLAFECGKLAAVSWLGRYGAVAPRSLRLALVLLVTALMGLDVIGAYGFLAKSQIEHSVLSDAAIEARETQVRAKLDVQAATVADLDRRLSQIDGAVEKATAKGRAIGAMQLAADQKRNRADLLRERQHQADTLANMKAEEAGLSAQRRVAAADLGPVRYLASLAGVPADEMLRWFVLLVAFLIDPAAVLLLFAATQGRRGRS